MKITLELLEQNGACADQRRLFAETFPKGANVNTRNLSKAQKVGLDVLWLAQLLPEGRKAECDKVRDAARAEYEKVRDAAWAEYNKVRGEAWAEYDKVRGAALTECDKVCGAALTEYEKVRDAAWAEYEKVCGAALVRAFEGL